MEPSQRDEQEHNDGREHEAWRPILGGIDEGAI
jgi:hypothetical protein